MTKKDQRAALTNTALDYDEVAGHDDNDDYPSKTRCKQCGADELYYDDGCQISCAACEA